jgi:hypothetical protein
MTLVFIQKMSEKSTRDYFLSIKDIITESLIRDLVLFCLLFILIINQSWDDILLLLFPLITFGFSLFFKIINSNKWRTEFDNGFIIYNPLGLEKKHANRLSFSTFIQLILILWLGAESLYNSHIVQTYFFYFNLIFMFCYSFGFYWIFLDLWKYLKIEVLGNEKTKKNSSIVSILKLKHFKLISLMNVIIFLSLNLINLVFIFFITQIPSIGLQLNLPGPNPFLASPVLYASLIISPTFAAISLLISYRQINTFSRDHLNTVLKSLPDNVQKNIMENLKALNNKIKDQLKIE